MSADDRVVLYSTIARLMDGGKFSEVSKILCNMYDTHDTQSDLSLIMGILRLSFLYKDQIGYWQDIADLVYNRLDNAENLMRGLVE
jgi:hypothetical protein